MKERQVKIEKLDRLSSIRKLINWLAILIDSMTYRNCWVNCYNGMVDARNKQMVTAFLAYNT